MSNFNIKHTDETGKTVKINVHKTWTGDYKITESRPSPSLFSMYGFFPALQLYVGVITAFISGIALLVLLIGLLFHTQPPGSLFLKWIVLFIFSMVGMSFLEDHLETTYYSGIVEAMLRLCFSAMLISLFLLFFIWFNRIVLLIAVFSFIFLVSIVMHKIFFKSK